nr:hypothetical protein [Tanacetum cinerariifolium]
MLAWLVLQGLRESRKLKHGALSMYMGNGMCAAIKAIRYFDLILPSGLIIVLDNCHFAPSVTWSVVLISHLVNNGYIHTFMNYGISVSKDNVFYFNAIPRDGIYEIDMHNLYLNVSSMFNVSNKRAKYSLESSYLWHCHLGNINKERMEKLQRDGILQPTHDESLKKCKPCISGKMARKHFPHQVKRANYLLGLIHTDVCGPFRTVSREGASYFITFTDDFSRYGYVYLMKHKHEVFETFKVFQNEVENQLGKKIKAIRSDRGGEYLSHEFINHMTSYGIVSQLTSPYTPQHNGVSERRNKTLLDMVRSMTNLTIMPKSFCLMVQEVSGSHGLLESSGSDGGLELIQKEDTQPYENTSKIHNEVTAIEAALSDPEFDKWLEDMNTEMQSMKDNQVWVLVDLPPNGQTVGSKWLFKKRLTWMAIHFQQNPSEIHWTAVKAILMYLRNTKDMVLMYGVKPEAKLKAFCYANAGFQTEC